MTLLQWSWTLWCFFFSRRSSVSNKSIRRPLCLATTKSNMPCKMSSVTGSAFCYKHQVTKWSSYKPRTIDRDFYQFGFILVNLCLCCLSIFKSFGFFSSSSYTEIMFRKMNSYFVCYYKKINLRGCGVAVQYWWICDHCKICADWCDGSIGFIYMIE